MTRIPPPQTVAEPPIAPVPHGTESPANSDAVASEPPSAPPRTEGQGPLRQCCCGKRLLNPGECFITNDTLHERLGDEGAFCGPVIAHDLRDARAAAENARAEIQRERERADREKAEADRYCAALDKAIAQQEAAERERDIARANLETVDAKRVEEAERRGALTYLHKLTAAEQRLREVEAERDGWRDQADNDQRDARRDRDLARAAQAECNAALSDLVALRKRMRALAEEYDRLPVAYVRGPISAHGPSIGARLRSLSSETGETPSTADSAGKE